MRRLGGLVVVLAAGALLVPASSMGHAERQSFFPNHELGEVPPNPSGAPDLVVCKSDSEQRIRNDLSGNERDKNLRYLDDCRFRNIQSAVDAADNGDHIGVLPGVYEERPSQRVPDPDPRCEQYREESGIDLGGLGEGRESGGVPTYKYHRKCPNSQNLIAIMGDDGDSNRRCDDKCDIAIEGTADRGDVLISGQGYGQTPGAKLNVIRADRADGVYLGNFTIQFSDFNNVYALETNGFRFNRIESRYSREYGFLSFTSDNGLYENLEAYGAGDSGIYPGSGPEGHCERYGIEIRNSNSHGNTIGYSGTAGNGVYAHDNRFHHNAAGLTTDSFASGHPGMPQDCAKWTDNEFYSNNLNLFSEARDEYCNTDNRSIEERDPKKVCPTFQVPVGTGLLIAGGNRNIIRNNRFWDNWRAGAMQFFVPAAARGEDDPSKQMDTSHGNTYIGNKMGVRPGGGSDPNGVDFWWDEQGRRNCWENNTSAPGRPLRSNPSSLPECPGSAVSKPPSPEKSAFLLPCATWDPQDNPDPPGCRTDPPPGPQPDGYSWFEQPDEPG